VRAEQRRAEYDERRRAERERLRAAEDERRAEQKRAAAAQAEQLRAEQERLKAAEEERRAEDERTAALLAEERRAEQERLEDSEQATDRVRDEEHRFPEGPESSPPAEASDVVARDEEEAAGPIHSDLPLFAWTDDVAERANRRPQ
jgi:hypothetical protein